jgi:hypothetical protein
LPVFGANALANPAMVAAVSLSAASFVAGLIANANRRNVDVYMLQAVLEDLHIIQEQIASLQSAMSVIMDDLATLPTKIAQIVAKNSVRQLHGQLLAEVENFNRIELYDYTGRDLQKWLHADSGRINRLIDRQRNIQRLAGQLRNSSQSCDPTAALVLEAISDAEFKLMVLCNSDAKPVFNLGFLTATAVTYRQQFDRVVDDQRVGSAAWFLADRETARAQTISAINDNRLGFLSNAMRWSKADPRARELFFNCAQVQDFTTVEWLTSSPPVNIKREIRRPQVSKHRREDDREVHRIFQSIGVAEHDALDNVGTQKLLASAKIIPKKDEFSGILLKELMIDPLMYQSRSKGDRWLGGPLEDCPEERVELDGERDNQRSVVGRIRSTKSWSYLASQYDPLRSLLDDFNSHTAEIAYAKEGMASAERSIKNIDTFLAYLRKQQ